MRFSFSLVAAGILFTSNAFADDGASFVNGDWIGTGSFQMGADIVACQEIKMRFSGSKETYVVREASMICGNAPKQDFTDIDGFVIKDDGQIYFDSGKNTKIPKGTKVGAAKDDALRTVNPIENDNVDDISIRKAGDFLIYNQVAGVPGKNPDYALMAIMKKDASAASKP
jgi:hypothetical protein